VYKRIRKMSIRTFSTACFVAALQGNYSALVLPHSPNYNQSVTVLNLNIPIAPAAVTYPSTAEEVAGVVRCAAKAGLKVQAKSGGHNWANFGKERFVTMKDLLEARI
jgi:FAD/FMN-containing dehydrogenase